MPAKPKPPKPPPRSWIWVGTDAPESRIVPHDVTLAVGFDGSGAGGATIDLFVERGGNEFAGLTVQALRVPGVRALAELRGAEVVDPPPAVVGIGKLGAGLGGCGGAPKAPNPLRRLGLSVEGDLVPAPDAAPEPAEPEIDMDAEEASPDDDPTLGDIDTYRRRRAEEARLAPPDADPDLDAGALEEADAAAAAERVLIAPGQAYEVEAIVLRFRSLDGRSAEIDVEGRCAAIDEHGEIERSGVPFGGKLVARVEVDA